MARRLRVLMVTGALPPIPCGVGDYTARLATALVETNRARVAVLGVTPESDEGRSLPDEQFRRLSTIHAWNAWRPTRTLAGVALWRPDVVHIQWPGRGYSEGRLAFLARILVKVFRIPLVLTLHEHIPAGFTSTQSMASLARLIITVRPNFATGFVDGFSSTVKDKELVVIENGPALPQVVATPQQRDEFRKRLGIPESKAIVSYFGLFYPSKGVEQLFEIADPRRHHILLMGGQAEGVGDYYSRVVRRTEAEEWRGAASILGFLPPSEAALALACSDAVVLPFLQGGGIWNTSIHGARLQRTFILTTSTTAQGYDPKRNIYWSRPGDVNELRSALDQYCSVRVPESDFDVPEWDSIADRHLDAYQHARTIK
jgi:glycosyltransferase involved in cell wall biosynthesis